MQLTLPVVAPYDFGAVLVGFQSVEGNGITAVSSLLLADVQPLAQRLVDRPDLPAQRRGGSPRLGVFTKRARFLQRVEGFVSVS